MFWQNTGKWASQYDPNVDSYIGSADDGGDDPQIGYAAYDFETWFRFLYIEIYGILVWRHGKAGTRLLTIQFSSFLGAVAFWTLAQGKSNLFEAYVARIPSRCSEIVADQMCLAESNQSWFADVFGNVDNSVDKMLAESEHGGGHVVSFCGSRYSISFHQFQKRHVTCIILPYLFRSWPSKQERVEHIVTRFQYLRPDG